ncbi:MAG: DUF1614 domain-containing protein [Acetobacteraceae bacterium]|nr:DUF1614 domain-containing protein [Acetobacteraceae bacterium]
MQYGQFHYLPVSPLFFAILTGLFLFLLIFIQLGLLRYAYMRLGLSSGAALLLLFASLVGSFFNIPIAQLPAQQVVSGREIEFFGMVYLVPEMVRAPSTTIAVNVGGALIPTAVSLFLLVRHGLWLRGAVATLVVAIVCYALSQPIRGLGIAEPVFVPALTSAVVAIILSREYAAPLAYIGGSLGTLIGADLLNLGSVGGLGAPVASIGGAGTFDGIFLIGIVSVLIASLSTWWVTPHAPPHAA